MGACGEDVTKGGTQTTTASRSFHVMVLFLHIIYKNNIRRRDPEIYKFTRMFVCQHVHVRRTVKIQLVLGRWDRRPELKAMCARCVPATRWRETSAVPHHVPL